MATYNSSQAGNWSDNNTWGGGGSPNATDDIANISHNVVYDLGVSTVLFGNVTINANGTLNFPTNANSQLQFNNVGTLTVNNNASLIIGNNSTPVGANYECSILWQNGASARDVLSASNNAIISVYGDPNVFGNDIDSELFENWIYEGANNLTLKIKGNFTNKWKANQWIVVERHYNGTASDPWTNQVPAFQLNSIGAYDSNNNCTSLTVNSLASVSNNTTFYADGWVVNLTRNVKLGANGTNYELAAHNSSNEYIRAGTIGNYDSYNNMIFSCVEWKGWQSLGYNGTTGSWTHTYDRCTFINQNYGHQYTYRSSFLDCIFWSMVRHSYNPGRDNYYKDCYFLGLSSGLLAQDMQFFERPKISSSEYAVYGGSSGSLFLDLIARHCDYFAVYGVANYYINPNIFRCTSLFSPDSTNCVMIGATVDQCASIHSGGYNCIFSGDITNYTTLATVGDGTTTRQYRCSITFENTRLDGVEYPLMIYNSGGSSLPLDSGDGAWQEPPSGSDWILQFTPVSRIIQGYPVMIFSSKQSADYIPAAGDITLTFKIYPHGWATELDQDDIFIEAYCLLGTGMQRTTVRTTNSSFANDGWRDLTVNFVAGRAGHVYYNIYMRRYEASAYILIDPIWTLG